MIEGEFVAPNDAVDEKRVFMSVVRRVAKPFLSQGWSIGSSGLKLHADSGHWAHFWFFSSRFNQPFSAQPFVGTICPYLLRVFNKQRVDRAPHANFIAVHSQLKPIEGTISIGERSDGIALASTPSERSLTLVESPRGWSNGSRRFFHN